MRSTKSQARRQRRKAIKLSISRLKRLIERISARLTRTESGVELECLLHTNRKLLQRRFGELQETNLK